MVLGGVEFSVKQAYNGGYTQKKGRIENENKNYDDFSSIILSKVAQDLSKMINSVCSTEPKKKNYNMKLVNNFSNKNK